MERAEARKLQPHFIRSFFLTAFAHIGGGSFGKREPGRFEISNPSLPNCVSVNRQDRHGRSLDAPVRACDLRERVLSPPERGPLAEYVTPGHPLLDGTIDLIIERYDSLFRKARC